MVGRSVPSTGAKRISTSGSAMIGRVVERRKIIKGARRAIKVARATARARPRMGKAPRAVPQTVA